MDLAQALIFDLGWIFFAAWGIVLAAVSAMAFGRDLLPTLFKMKTDSKGSGHSSFTGF
jgi:hypothetical protein